MKKTVFYLMLFVFILAGTMISNAEKSNDVSNVEGIEQAYYTRMTGSIGQYPIVMHLDAFAKNGSYCGYYYYRSRPNTKFKLVVKATRTKRHEYWAKELTVYEYTPSGKHTGSFVGTAHGADCDGYVFSGTFYNSKGQNFRFYVDDDHE